MKRCFRIICLKRTNFVASNLHEYTSDWYDISSVCYWLPEYSGYTYNINEAGIYTLEELDHAAGAHLDWFASPFWVDDE